MDQKIKNFDRSIEQMMNESAVTPPHGMWNRISAELSAEVLPAAPVAAAAMPGRAMVGFFAGTLLLGATFTAYLVNNNTGTQILEVQKEAPMKELPITNIAAQKHEEPIMVMEVQKIAPVSVSRKSVVPLTTAQPKVEEQATAMQVYPNVAEVAVPSQTISNATSSADPYYFPPVDIVNAETKSPATNSIAAKPVDTEDDEPKVEEKKSKSSYGSDRKLKFKKKKSSSFSYGRLNRLKNPK